MRTIRFETDDGQQMTLWAGGNYPNAASSDLDLRKGEVYLVEPMNPQKKRHRGRLCTYQGYKADDYGFKLRVRFLDNNRPGVVDTDDLVSAPEQSQEQSAG